MGILFDHSVIVSDGVAVLPSMVFDIDVVSDVHAEVKRVTGHAPRLVWEHLPEGYAMPIQSEIAIEELQNISPARRRALQLLVDAPEYVDQFVANFRSDQQTRISYGRDHELVATIANMLMKEGRRRPAWRRLSPLIPAALAAVFSVLTVLALIVERPRPIELLASLTLIVIVVSAAAVFARHLRANTWYLEQGAKFRRVSRAAVRDRIVNVRASAWVALFFTPLGAVVGWFLNAWFGR